MHKNTLIKTILIFCLTLTAHAELGAGKTYQKGSAVAPFKAADQHGRAYTFQKGTRFLLVSFDMATGKKANKVLHEKGAAYLPGKKAVYVANIYGMPGIGRAFALPKMRKYAHPIVLADAKGLLDRFPSQKGKVTVLSLTPRGVVSKVSYWEPKTEKIESVLE